MEKLDSGILAKLTVMLGTQARNWFIGRMSVKTTNFTNGQSAKHADSIPRIKAGSVQERSVDLN